MLDAGFYNRQANEVLKEAGHTVLPEPTTTPEKGLTVEEVSKERARRRREQGEGRLQEPPLVEWKAPSDKPTMTLREMNENTTFTRKAALGVKRMEAGVPVEEAFYGADQAPSQPPPKVVGVAMTADPADYMAARPKGFGPISDHAVQTDTGTREKSINRLMVDGYVAPLSVDEATQGVRNFREADANYRADQEAERQRLLAEKEEQGRLKEQLARAQAEDEAKARPQQPQQPRQQQSSAAAEQARLARVRAEMDRMSVAEHEIVGQLRQHRAWAAQAFPELHDPTGNRLKETFSKNPARFAQIQQAYAADQQAERQFYETRQNRQLREAVFAQHQEKQMQAVQAQQRTIENNKFDAWFKTAMPEYATDEARARLRKSATAVLKDAGYNDQQIDAIKRQGLPAEQQMILAQAAKTRDMQARYRELANKRLPPVQPHAPGVAPRPSGAADAERVRDLNRQLAGAKGNQSVKLAAELTRARRAAGLLRN
jgi:hypothetical protein